MTIATLLTEQLEASGWKVKPQNDSLVAEKQAIAAQWFLGKRKVTHRLSIKLNAAERQCTLKETATEITLGIAPPSFIVTRTTQQGTRYTENRIDSGLGGGQLNYGEGRELVEGICQKEGWAFKLGL